MFRTKIYTSEGLFNAFVRGTNPKINLTEAQAKRIAMEVVPDEEVSFKQVGFAFPDGSGRLENIAPWSLYGDAVVTPPGPPGATVTIVGDRHYVLNTREIEPSVYKIGITVTLDDGTKLAEMVTLNIGEANWPDATNQDPDPAEDPVADDQPAKAVEGKWFLLSKPGAYDLVVMERYRDIPGIDPLESEAFADAFKALVDEFWIDNE